MGVGVRYRLGHLLLLSGTISYQYLNLKIAFYCSHFGLVIGNLTALVHYVKSYSGKISCIIITTKIWAWLEMDLAETPRRWHLFDFLLLLTCFSYQRTPILMYNIIKIVFVQSDLVITRVEGGKENAQKPRYNEVRVITRSSNPGQFRELYGRKSLS